jgi:hypothetical protein
VTMGYLRLDVWIPQHSMPLGLPSRKRRYRGG